MAVNNKESSFEKIREIWKGQNGILLTSDLAKFRILRTYLSILVKKGEIQRVSRGVYSAANYMVDEMASLQARYKGAIFSHETALYLLGLTDRTPLFFSMTVPAVYNATPLKASGVKVYFVNRGIYSLGVITIKTPYGNDIKSFNLERTICDVLRSRNKIDVQFVNEGLKKYVVHKDRNIDQLYNYAKQLRIQNIVRDYTEIML